MDQNLNINTEEMAMNSSSLKSNSNTLGVETDLSCSLQSKKDVFFKTPNGKKYLIFEDKMLNDAEADKIYRVMSSTYPNIEDSNPG